MRIAFIGCRDTPVSIFSSLGKALSSKVSGLELEERFVPFAEDLPVVALEASAESDFVFVFAMLEGEDEVGFVKEKLVEVELSTKTRILKAVSVDDVSDLDEEEYLEKKQELVSTYLQLIIDILFNERAFEPKEKDFSL